jgi:hypothetical protein
MPDSVAHALQNWRQGSVSAGPLTCANTPPYVFAVALACAIQGLRQQASSTLHVSSPTPPVLHPLVSVVLMLSEEFISKKYPMEELQLLLEWRWQDKAGLKLRKQGTRAELVPVFYDLTYQDLSQTIAEHNRKAAQGTEEDQQRMRQWVKDLKKLQGITGLRQDQVLQHALLSLRCSAELHQTCVCRFVLLISLPDGSRSAAANVAVHCCAPPRVHL